MSIFQVKKVIEEFIQNDKNDLLVIKGDWGVGKTYFWQETIAEVSKRGGILHKNYSYVSLFE
jgi:tRNA A37 threonylcarbamoyladenosine biosynthesis protein TsaE